MRKAAEIVGSLLLFRLCCFSLTDKEIRQKSASNPDRNKHRQAEQSLQEYQAILAHAEEVPDLGSWKWDLRTKKVNWSEGMFRLFGVDRESFDGDLDRIIANRIHQPVNLKNLVSVTDKLMQKKN